MNIESTNLVNVLPGTTTADGLSSSLLVDGAASEGFADALKNLIQLQIEINNTSQALTESQNIASSVLSKPFESVQEPAVLLGNNLPVSYKVNDKDDVEAALSVVTDSLKYLETDAGVFTETAQMAPVINVEQMPLQVNADEGSADSVAQLDVSAEETKTDQLKAEGDRAEDVSNQDAQVAQMILMPSTEAAYPVVRSSSEDSIKEAEQLSLAKPFSENSKAKPSYGTTQIKGDAPQQKLVDQESYGADMAIDERIEVSVSGKSMQNKQSITVSSDVDMPITGTVVNGQFDKSITEAKLDVPAMTRPLTHPEWNKDLGERIVWMNNRAMPAAEIKLNPQHLGPVSVRIDMNQDQASIVFTSPHAAVRDALEASVPKLREMLNEQQINLVNVSVAQNGGSEQRHSQSQSFNQSGIEAETVADVADGVGVAENERVVTSNGLLNMYA